MMKNSIKISQAICVILLLAGGASADAAERPSALDLPATAIFSKGPNEWNGDVLEITRGRGAIIGWYVLAKQEEEVRVTIEYSCDQPLNQAYQLSFDGQDRFWEVMPTPKKTWTQAELGTFRLLAGRPTLVVLVPPSGTKYPHPLRFRKLVLAGNIPDNLSLLINLPEPATPDATPGFGQKLSSLHPALIAQDLREEGRTMRISGMAMRGPQELIFTTWEGDLFSLDLEAISENSSPPLKKIAQGLSEPMGLAVADGRIFVTEKNEATELIDEDGDGLFETYRCLSHDWPCTLDYHEYLFGAVVKDAHLYFSSSVAMGTRGKDNYQAPLRGSVIKVHVDSGETAIVAGGLRTPDGMGHGPNGSILVTDNQGEWLPANKLIHVQQDAFYQFRSRPPWHPLDRLQPTPPAVWLPQGEIASSPTEPILLPDVWEPYAGQVIFGDATFGGLQRAFLEEIEGVMQGAVFPFSQGFRHLFHRFAFTPAGELVAGGIARGKDWDFIARVSGLTRIRYTGKEVFEPLAVRIRSSGLEIEFTMPLAPNSGWDPAGYYVTQWGYQGTQTYGGAKVRYRRTQVRSATVSPDRRRVFLELPEMLVGEVVHVRLPETLPAESGLPLWMGEFWYTVNRIPAQKPGSVRPAPADLVATSIPFFHFSEDNAGRILYQNFCASCHSLDGSKRVGPTFLGLVGATRTVLDTTSGESRQVKADLDYLRQSLIEPNALLVEGYPENLMPPIGGMLTDMQLKNLLDYVTKSSDPEFARVEAVRKPDIVREWTMSDFDEVGQIVLPEATNPAVIVRGMQAFMKAQCLQCHAVSGYGAKLAPDLTETVKKYQGAKLLRQIIEPSSELHPEYHTSQFLMANGNVVSGTVIQENDNEILVATDLLMPHELTRLAKSEIDERRVAKNSAMPDGLVNILTKSEILDLLMFLEAGPAPIVQSLNTPSAK